MIPSEEGEKKLPAVTTDADFIREQRALTMRSLNDQLAAKEARILSLEKALEPFVKAPLPAPMVIAGVEFAPKDSDPFAIEVLVGDLRLARSLLKGKDE